MGTYIYKGAVMGDKRFFTRLIKTTALNRWVLRDNAEVRSKKPSTKASLQWAVDKHNRRKGKKVNKRCLSVGERFAERFMPQETFIEQIVKAHYKNSESSWAGGDTEVHVNWGRTHAAKGFSITVWSSNGKWKGSNAVYNITLPYSWIKNVYKEGLAEAGGMLTLTAEKIRENLWKATWVQQSRGFSIKCIEGYIGKYSDGTFVHSKTEKGIQTRIKRRASFIQRAATSKYLKELSVEELISSYGDIHVLRKYTRENGYFGDTIECGLAFDAESGKAVEVHLHGCHRANAYTYGSEEEMLYYYDNHPTVHFPQIRRHKEAQ